MCGQLLQWQWQCEERSGEAVGRVELSILWKKIQIGRGLCPRAQRSGREEEQLLVGGEGEKRKRSEGLRGAERREREESVRKERDGESQGPRTVQGGQVCCFLALAEAKRKLKLRGRVSPSLRRWILSQQLYEIPKAKLILPFAQIMFLDGWVTSWHTSLKELPEKRLWNLACERNLRT
jgi:hypothetical protein